MLYSTIILLISLIFFYTSFFIAKSFNLLDMPDTVRKIHQTPVPKIGGIIIYSGLLARSGMFGSQAGLYSSLNPFAAGDLFYQQQQALVAPEEERMRTDLETRLLSQGRLGTTGGGRNIENLEKGLATARDARRISSFNQAQSLIDALLGRESADIESATSLLDVPYQQGKLGMGIGGTVGSGVSAASKARTGAVTGLANAYATSPLGTALTYGSGLFGQPKKEKT